ncbi:hypothetical protein FVEG_13266 [Fusarium verticillioides 7600]|uniref:Cdc24/Scd1 N-terminal domain-containing protein n=1 Tax=Gibberella moniliformis (strain M3125 / FGSC 7600) TaxID=334819 RepID=W7N552_GIBM7|nr:hypothetical protein FVEG_13266 [Fusarium verticillioides 7600]EWG55230.1 hypothetical protein FVEG_13266 [Fusarium verticillioides 7600]
MDPLSVIASVAGIATAAGEVIKILGPYTTATKDAPKIAAEVSSEALATQTIITGLEQLINNFSAANVRYASLIQVDQLTAVLFDGVKIFSELLAVLQTLPPLEPSSPGGSLWTPIQWVRKKSSLTAIVHRLQAFKSSIICILSILQSDSQARAEESQQQLIAAVDDLLRGNTDLSRRMMGMANTIDTMSHRRATIQSTRDMGVQERMGLSSRRSSLFEFDFEQDLKLSRVYRNAKRDTMDFSANSSIVRTHAWSSLSGVSLSDISHISVLALPLYVEDISNPEHYRFGQEAFQLRSILVPTRPTRSIYHDCIEVQLQLSQFKWFARFQQQESSMVENPLSNLISIFKIGTPLLMIFNELDNSHHERWKDLIASSPSDEVSSVAITEFVKACMLSSDIPRSYCIFDADILLTDTTHHVKKVISLVRFILARLTKVGTIQAIVFESAPNIFASEPNPAGVAVDAFLCDERLYLKRLESLLEDAEKIRSLRMLPLDAFDPLFAPVRQLVSVQRTFLIKVEMLISKPYLWQTWQTALHEWAVDSSGYYAALITAEANLKSMVRTAISSADIYDIELRESLGNVLAMLGLPSQRLDKYDAFLQELAQYGLHNPNHIKAAVKSLAMVEEAVENSTITRELSRVKATLSKEQDYETNKIIWGLGKLLIFSKVDVMDSRQEKQNQLYLFENGILQAVESFPKHRRRGIQGYGKSSLSDSLKARVSVIRIIPGKDIQQVRRVLLSPRQESNGCEIKWLDVGKERRMSFSLGSRTRSLEWMYQVARVKDKARLDIPDHKFQRIVFTKPFFGDQFNYCENDTCCRSCVIDNEVALIGVTDTTGQEEHSYPTKIYGFGIRAAGFMLVYSVSSLESFKEILDLHHAICRETDKDNFPMVIVGIQCLQESLREVTTQQGEKLARELGCTFFEIDADSRAEVDAVFFDLVQEVRRYRRNVFRYR